MVQEMIILDPNIPVVLLCGGKGTRIKEKTGTIPKPMVEIGGKPILWHIMKLYSSYGYNRFVTCLGYKGPKIKEYFLYYDLLNCDLTTELGKKSKYIYHDNHSEENWAITFANTGENSMTGSRVKKIEKYIDSDAFMLTYGDGLCDVDINKLVEFHKSHGKIGTVTGVHPPSRFGELITENNKVLNFNEKPQTSQGRINGGFFVLNRDFFNYLSADESCVLEKAPLEKLAEDGQLMMFAHDGFWQCMDTLRDMELLEKLWNQENCPWKKW